MHRAVYPVRLLLAGLLVVVIAAALAPAAVVDVSLNLLYTDPLDNTSGGTWQIAAKNPDGAGIYGLTLLLTGIGAATAAGPTGTVNGGSDAGFGEFDVFNYGSYREVVVGQIPVMPPPESPDEQSVFYGVGTLVNGAPNYAGVPENSIGPEFQTLTPPGISWAPGDLLGDSAWDTAAVLVTGAFSAGTVPALGFYSQGELFSTGNIFTDVPLTQQEIGPWASATVSTIIRDNLLPPLPGDYNNNRTVDAADYTVWRDAFEAGSNNLPNDPTPGTVDESDYTYWKTHFGEVAPEPGAGAMLSGAMVPEPAAWVLLVVAAGVLFFGRIAGFWPAGGVCVKKETIGVETA